MSYPCHRTLLPLLLAWFVGTCHSFSFDNSHLARSSFPATFVRHRHQPCHSATFCSRNVNVAPLTLRWNTPAESSAQSTAPAAADNPSERARLDLHPPTIQAIAQALFIRAQNTPGMPLRFIEDGKMEPWEIMLTAGKVSQGAAEEFAQQLNLNPAEDEEDEEVLQVMSGRIVAVLTRFEELEEDLLNRCSEFEDANEFERLGVPETEMKAWQSNEEVDATKRISDAAAAIDAACLFDKQLRHNRARSLLAMFLHEIEGPGLRRNNVVIPCMDVDFLSEEEWSMLLVDEDAETEIGSSVKEESDEPEDVTIDEPERPSLHPITIDAIEEAFRLRAQNMTTSPLRLIDAQTEWYDVQYSIIKFADRFNEKNTDGFQWTEEELQTIGGRIVGVLMRLDDLEWEWNNRISTSSLAEADSPSMIPYEMWKTTLGLHPDNVEQSCFLTVDVALSEEKDFARARAERMLALFLMNIESPGLEASGNKVPGGSYPDFIDDDVQLELMMPRSNKS